MELIESMDMRVVTIFWCLPSEINMRRSNFYQKKKPILLNKRNTGKIAIAKVIIQITISNRSQWMVCNYPNSVKLMWNGHLNLIKSCLCSCLLPLFVPTSVIQPQTTHQDCEVASCHFWAMKLFIFEFWNSSWQGGNSEMVSPFLYCESFVSCGTPTMSFLNHQGPLLPNCDQFYGRWWRGAPSQVSWCCADCMMAQKSCCLKPYIIIIILTYLSLTCRSQDAVCRSTSYPFGPKRIHN